MNQNPFSRTNDPDTSVAAGIKISKYATRLQLSILAVLAKYPEGMPCRELENYLPDLQSLTPRITTLESLGWVVRPGAVRQPIIGGVPMHSNGKIILITQAGLAELARAERT